LLPKKILRPLLLAALILAVVLILFLPTLRVLRLQSQAGALLEDVRQTAAGEYPEQFWCLLPLLTGLVEDPRLAEAADLLAQAVEINPSHPHTYFLLGRTHCLAGNFTAALTALTQYTHTRPDNPLGELELAFAAYAGNTFFPNDPTPFLTTFREVIGQVAVTGEDFYLQADQAFRIEDYPSAWLWYRIGEQLEPITGSRAFRKDLLDAVYTGVFSPSIQAAVEVIPLSTEAPVTILPSAFFRLSSGHEIFVEHQSGNQIGRFSQNTDDGGVFIKVPHSGIFRLTIYAIDQPPAPTLVGITINLRTIETLELTEGDGSLQSFSVNIKLESGYHLLGIKLENDDIIVDLDRNAYICLIEFSTTHNK
jgi:tetratricopeptide (TPR) repeat protein